MITPNLDDLDTKIKASLTRKKSHSFTQQERQGSCASPYLTLFQLTNLRVALQCR